MLKLTRHILTNLALTTVVTFGLAGPVTAQSAGSYTSGSSYNPVQQAINRNSMNAAIIRQATGGKHQVAAVRSTRKARQHR